MAFSRGDYIAASDIGTGTNSFFARLEAVRVRHWSSPGQDGANPGQFTTEQVTAGSKITSSWLQTLKNYITEMTKSKYVSTDYGTALALTNPIKATEFKAIDDAIKSLESLPVKDNAYNSGQYGYNSSYDSSQHAYDSSYDSSQHSYDSSQHGYNSGYHSSVASDFCVSFASSYSGECGALGYS